MHKLLWSVGLSFLLLGSFMVGYNSGMSAAPPPGDTCVGPSTFRLLVVPRHPLCPGGFCEHVDQTLFPTFEEPVYVAPLSLPRDEVGL